MLLLAACQRHSWITCQRVLTLFVCQGLVPSNSSGLDDGAEVRENMVELLRRSILYIEPVDPIYWCGALLKCEGRILPCLRVR